MERKKCFVCLQESRNEKERQLNDADNFSSSEEEITADKSEVETLKNQSDVIFLLRKFLTIPNDMCCKFLQDYGDPSFWIYCCDSCSVLVENAKSVFNQIELLKRKYGKLQMEFKNAIVRSFKSQTFYIGPSMGVSETVRYYISRDFENGKDSNSNANLSDGSEEPFGVTENYSDSGEIEDVKLFNIQEESKIVNRPKTKIKPRKEQFQVRSIQRSCSVCQKTFKDRRDLIRHQTVHTKEKAHCCEDCGKFFSDRSVLRRHQKIHNSENGESSEDKESSDLTIPGESSVEEQISGGENKVVAEGKSYSCSVCGKKYSTWSHLKRHGIVHSGEKSHPCGICEKKFSTSSHLKRHERIHTGEKPYSCDWCGKDFSDPSTLRKHVRNHTGGKPYGCKKCLEGFDNFEDLKMHEVEIHKETPTKYQCDNCDMDFISEKLLRNHEIVHREKSVFPCDSCDKTCPTAYHLKRHVARIHSAESLNFCDRCGKCFSSPTVLRRHIERHNEEDKYSCSMCGDGFADLRLLNRHMKVHTAEKQFPCKTCGKVFFTSRQSRNHEKIHSTEKPHSCAICQKTFNNKNNLTRHERTHTGEKPYKCDLCGFCFTTSSDLKRHGRRRHPNIPQINNQNENQKIEQIEPTDDTFFELSLVLNT